MTRVYAPGNGANSWRDLSQAPPPIDSYENIHAVEAQESGTGSKKIMEVASVIHGRIIDDAMAILCKSGSSQSEKRNSGIAATTIVPEETSREIGRKLPTDRLQAKTKIIEELRESSSGIDIQALRDEVRGRQDTPTYPMQIFKPYSAPKGDPVDVLLYPGKPYAIEIHRTGEGREIPDELVWELSHSYRYAFNNAGHFLVDPDSLQTFSPQEVLGVGQSTQVPLELMDGFDPTNYRHPGRDGGRPLILWHHPASTYYNLREKLGSKDGADLAIARDVKSKEIVGFSIARVTNLRNHFRAEWEDPLEYANHTTPSTHRSFDLFLEVLNDVLAEHRKFYDLLGADHILTPESNVYCWNALWSAGDMRHFGLTDDVLRAIFGSLPDDRGKLLNVAEVKHGSPADWIYMAVGFIKIYGFLARNFLPSPGDSVLIAARVDEIKRYFTEHSYRDLVSQLKKTRQSSSGSVNEDEAINRSLFLRKHLIPREIPNWAFRVVYLSNVDEDLVVHVEENPLPGKEVSSAVLYPVEIQDYPAKGMVLKILIRLNTYNVGGKVLIRKLQILNPKDPIEEAYAQAIKLHHLKGWQMKPR